MLRDRSVRPVPSHFLALPVLAMVMALGTACGDEGPAPIDRIEVTVEGGGALEVMKGEIIVLRARAFAGSEERVGAVIRFRSESPQIATVDSILGRVVGVDFGTAQVAVTANNEFTTRVAVQVIGPPIARIVIQPASAGATIGGTVRLVGLALGSAGDTLAGAEFTWGTTTPSILQVSASGTSAVVVTGVAPGVGTVEAVAWNNVKGTGNVTVLPVRDFSPRQGAFGTVVAIAGSGLAPPVKVAFARGLTATVEAEVGAVTPDTIYTWVPVGAESGPISVTLGGVSAPTAATFTVTGGGDDALEENDEPSTGNPQIPIGFYNPALVATINRPAQGSATPDEDWFLLPVTQATGEFTVEIGVRRGSGFTQTADQFRVDSLLQGALFRLEGQSLRWIAGYPFSGLMSYDFAADSSVRTLRVARRIAEPDTFFLLVLANSQGVNMPYSLRVRGTGVYAFGPDAFEENDATNEAFAVTLPTRFDAFAENGGELDFYSFTLGDSAKVRATLTGGTGDLDLWIGTDTSSLSGGMARGETPEPDEQVEVTLAPGKYVAGVWEFAMRGDAYNLELEKLPPSAVAAVAGARRPGEPGRPPGLAPRRLAADALVMPLRLPPGSPFRIVPPWKPPR